MFFYGKNVFSEINKSKLTSPLIIIDPVQKDRNAAAALSYEKFDMLRKRAKEFLKNPSKNFFEVKVLTEKDIKSHEKNIIILNTIPLKRKKDVAGAKFVKAFRFIQTRLELEGYKTINKDWKWDGEKEFKLHLNIYFQDPYECPIFFRMSVNAIYWMLCSL